MEQFQLESAKFRLRVISSLGLFCRVCIPDPSCNNQRRKESKREKQLHPTLTSFTLYRKANLRNWPGQVGKVTWKTVTGSPRPHPSPPPLSGNLKNHSPTQPLCYSPASKERDEEGSL